MNLTPIHLTITRPDLCYAVNQVSEYMKEQTVYHWSMVERILRYLKGSPGQGVWMGKNVSTKIVGYCDANYAGDTNDEVNYRVLHVHWRQLGHIEIQEAEGGLMFKHSVRIAGHEETHQRASMAESSSQGLRDRVSQSHYHAL